MSNVVLYDIYGVFLAKKKMRISYRGNCLVACYKKLAFSFIVMSLKFNFHSVHVQYQMLVKEKKMSL